MTNEYKERENNCYCVVAINKTTKAIKTAYSIGYTQSMINEIMEQENYVVMKIFKITYELYLINATEIEFDDNMNSYEIEEILQNNDDTQVFNACVKYRNILDYLDNCSFWFENQTITLGDLKKYNPENYKRLYKDYI